jgi:hypothetical protein
MNGKEIWEKDGTRKKNTIDKQKAFRYEINSYPQNFNEIFILENLIN